MPQAGTTAVMSVGSIALASPCLLVEAEASLSECRHSQPLNPRLSPAGKQVHIIRSQSIPGFSLVPAWCWVL